MMNSKMNTKMEGLKDCEDIDQIPKSFEKALDFDHPCVFPVSCGENSFFLVVLPMLAQREEKEEVERLGFILENSQNLDFQPPLLNEEAWHEINNPLAIISLTLQKAFRKVILKQEDIDELMGRLDDNFKRIDNFIIDQIQSS